MSRTGSIRIEIPVVDRHIYLDVYRTLTSNGWTANRNGKISFMIGGSYDWEVEDFTNLNNVLDSICCSIDRSLEANIDLSWENSDIGIGLSYTNSKEIVFLLAENLKKLTAIDVVDFSWYLERIAPVFSQIDFFRIECDYD